MSVFYLVAEICRDTWQILLQSADFHGKTVYRLLCLCHKLYIVDYWNFYKSSADREKNYLKRQICSCIESQLYKQMNGFNVSIQFDINCLRGAYKKSKNKLKKKQILEIIRKRLCICKFW